MNAKDDPEVVTAAGLSMVQDVDKEPVYIVFVDGQRIDVPAGTISTQESARLRPSSATRFCPVSCLFPVSLERVSGV